MIKVPYEKEHKFADTVVTVIAITLAIVGVIIGWTLSVAFTTIIVKWAWF